jgi:hypothetical protein
VSAQVFPDASGKLHSHALWTACQDLDKVAYSPSYARIAGSLAAGLLLAQIIYWFRPGKTGLTKLRVVRKNKLWLAKSREEWCTETGLSLKQVKGALNRLITLGLIGTERHLFAGKVTVHVFLNEAVLLSAIEELNSIGSQGINQSG